MKTMLSLQPHRRQGAGDGRFGRCSGCLYQGGLPDHRLSHPGKGGCRPASPPSWAGQFDRVVCFPAGTAPSARRCPGLMQLDHPPVLGYIPFGSTNDCATTLRLPRDPVKAAQTASETGVPRPWDIGRLNGSLRLWPLSAPSPGILRPPGSEKHLRPSGLCDGGHRLPPLHHPLPPEDPSATTRCWRTISFTEWCATPSP